MAEIKLTELFDRKEYKWVQKGDGYWRATIDNIGGREYSITASREDYGWYFLDNKSPDIPMWNLSFTPTENALSGTDLESTRGAQFKIFSAAANAFIEFIQQIHPEYIYIATSNVISKRFRIYMKMINRFMDELEKLGYNPIEMPKHRNIDFDKQNDGDFFAMKLR